MIHRCVLCNTVNNPDIETDYGDFKEYMGFRPDPDNELSYICMKCYESIDSIRVKDSNPFEDIDSPEFWDDPEIDNIDVELDLDNEIEEIIDE